jgi:cell division protein FtsB
MAVKRTTPPVHEAQLQARIAELEAQLEARTQTIVTLAARISELEGDTTAAVVERAHRAEVELSQLRATKLFRIADRPRRVYARLRGAARG